MQLQATWWPKFEVVVEIRVTSEGCRWRSGSLDREARSQIGSDALFDWRAGLSLADLWGVGALEEVETGEFVELHTKKSFVFERGARNVSCYRIPALVQTGKGTLVAFAEARHESCGDDDVHEIAYRRSLNNAYSWTKVAFAVGSATYKVGNPMPVIVKDASRKSGEFILLLYVTHDDQCNKECGTGNAVIKSGDEGKTWSNPLD
eukprot:2021388-Amphidinium_carterae.1